MDNASIHHIELRSHQKGNRVLFLPAYSLDLNPIEEVFSKMKAFVGSNKASFQSASVHMLPLLLYLAFIITVTSQDCHRTFTMLDTICKLLQLAFILMYSSIHYTHQELLCPGTKSILLMCMFHLCQ